jgi:cell wall-associated NlpC family hydrolase
MRSTEVSARVRRVGGRDRRAASVVASLSSCALLALGVWVAPAAGADPKDPLPSRGEVQQAESDAQDAATRVAELQAALALANADLEAAAVAAAQAYEAYNGARWRADRAAAELRKATENARRAEHALTRQRDRLAGFVASSYQDAGSLSALDAVLGADGPEGVMDELLAYEGASASLDSELQEFAATDDLAVVFRAEAADARQAKLQLLDDAEAARDAATAAAASAQAVADAVAEQKAGLVAELARLQGISVRLAEQRQAALEEVERERAAEAAAQAAREAAEAAAQEAAQEAAEEAARRRAELQDAEDSEDSVEVQEDQPSQAPAPAPAPPPVPAPPVDPTPPAPAGGAAAAIAFAKSQLGEPYVWGAAGPDSWDCSGLTMAAWRAGGVSLPHYSVAQYDAATPIGVGELRPGDLLFWGTTSSPGSIFHVALYLGDGMMIHAPRTGRPVVIDSMYYWVPPTFFGRV